MEGHGTTTLIPLGSARGGKVVYCYFKFKPVMAVENVNTSNYTIIHFSTEQRSRFYAAYSRL